MTNTATRPNVRGWLRCLLSGQAHQVIGGPGDPYMLRWYVLPKTPWLRVYVHKFLRSDDDRALHDHPWWFVSIILRGGYVEVSESVDRKMTVLCRTSLFDVRSPFWRRAIVYRPATYRHRVQLPRERQSVPTVAHPRAVAYLEQPCWTLIVTGPKVREWGFWCKDLPDRYAENHAKDRDRFVHWREWGDGGCGETS